MKYNKKEIDSELVKKIASRYNISLLLASIFVRRGITEPEKILFYLEDDIKYLHNPFLFKDMEDAVERILSAADEGEKVIVFGDRDADGISSTVILVKKLQELGLDVKWSLPAGDEPYGFTEAKVDSFANEGGTLIITVDCGISIVKEIKYANSLGIDTIIIDHHMQGEVLPEAFAIINPKIKDCGYPFRDLSGCGVTAKVIWALNFAETAIYKKRTALLNIVPVGAGSYEVVAQRIFNLTESAPRYREVFVPETVSETNISSLVKYLDNSIIAVYGDSRQKKLFADIFGSSFDLNVYDLEGEVSPLFPRLKGMSLLQMREISRDARYTDTPVTELDILKSLFIAVAMKKTGSLNKNFESLTDFVTIGTIADMMPLTDENRILVKHGIKKIHETENPGLHELLYKQKLLDKQLTTTDIAWNITPIINAAGRMGVPKKAADLFFSTSAEEVRPMAEEVISLNKERKKIGDTQREMLLPLAKKSFEEMGHSLVLTGGSNVHRGITGILSARFATFFGVPAIVYTVLEGKKIVGSVRSMGSVPIMDMLSYCGKLFTDFGGHDFAGGFSMAVENFDKLKEKLSEYLKETVCRGKGQEGDSEKIIEIDAELPAGYLNKEVTDAVNTLMPFGEGCPPPVFLAKSFVIKSAEIIGNKTPGHVKMSIECAGVNWPAIFWNSADRAGKDFAVNDTVDVIFKIKNNYMANNSFTQLDIVDIQRV